MEVVQLFKKKDRDQDLQHLVNFTSMDSNVSQLKLLFNVELWVSVNALCKKIPLDFWLFTHIRFAKTQTCSYNALKTVVFILQTYLVYL